TQTFVNQTTLPTPSSGVQLATSAAYDPQSGAQLSATGMNSDQTQVTQYDRLLRPMTVTSPNGGVATIVYNGNDTEVDQTRGSGPEAVTHTAVDAYGRKSRVAVYNGQSGNAWYQVDYCYDAAGLLQFQSVRYQGSGFAGANANKQCTGAGTSYIYDALGRVTSTTNADGTASSQYNGRTVRQTDVSGAQKITQYDLLGRISTICEISSSNLQGDPPQTCLGDIGGYTGYVTQYDYSVVNTTKITQGAQTRTFTTDLAGRTTSVSEPERGTTTYSYSYNPTGLQVIRTRPTANQTSATVVTTTTTQYDSLGRPLTVIYSDGTPTRNYTYDTSVAWPIISQQNIKGMLSMASSNIAPSYEGTVYSYNAMGQIVGMAKCQPSGCSNRAFDKLLPYSYDLLGNMTSSSDGAGVTISYQYSPASEVQSITSSLNDANHPSALVSNVQNGPYGPTSYQMGNGLTSVLSYDAMGRGNGSYACTNSTQVGCAGGTQLYGYAVAWQGSRLASSADSVQGYQATYGYDGFNRLTNVNVTSGSASSYSYVYDRYGNRWGQNPAQSGPAPQLTFNSSTNQITTGGFSYDAAGNMLSDGLNSYQYDAEGNMISSGGQQLSYDALNEQIQTKFIGASFESEIVFDQWGKTSSLWKANVYNAVQGNSEIDATAYWGSTAIESYQPGSSTSHFRYRDWVGSLRMETNAAGVVTVTRAGLPFGDATSNTSGSRDVSFDGYAGYWDGSTSTTNHAPFREYSNLAGRWMSPDPYDGSYDSGNPQSFNRYSYVLNNPLGYVDPSGLQCQVNANYGDIYDDGIGDVCDEVDPDGGTYQVYSGGDGGCPVDACATTDPNPPIDPCLLSFNCGLPPTQTGTNQTNIAA
ncbi:MAG: RHS repeat-associated core domain-containing protein, partial [Edaphobacter sp.]